MTKQEFITAYEVVERFHNDSCLLGDSLNSLLLDGHAVVKFGGELQKEYIKLLADKSGVEAELLEQLLYEGCYSIFVGNPGEETEYRIVTADDLWEAVIAWKEYLKTIL